MDITEDKRKNEVELTAIKRAMRNTRWWKVFITVFMIAGIVAPVISIHAISTLQDMGSMLSAKYKEISVDKPGKQAALASVNKWLDTNKGPFRYGTTNLLWDSATKVGSSDEDTGTGKEHTDWWSHQFSLTDLSDGSKCIVVKESFGNAFVPFLVDHYQTVYVIDYRYYSGSVSALAKANGVTDVIFANNLSAIRGSYQVGKLAGVK